jgi:hypothetical protein
MLLVTHGRRQLFNLFVQKCTHPSSSAKYQLMFAILAASVSALRQLYFFFSYGAKRFVFRGTPYFTTSADLLTLLSEYPLKPSVC